MKRQVEFYNDKIKESEIIDLTIEKEKNLTTEVKESETIKKWREPDIETKILMEVLQCRKKVKRKEISLYLH